MVSAHFYQNALISFFFRQHLSIPAPFVYSAQKPYNFFVALRFLLFDCGLVLA